MFEFQNMLRASLENGLTTMQKGWQVGNVNGASSFVFKTDKQQAKPEMPTFKLMQQTLHYARELERIV